MQPRYSIYQQEITLPDQLNNCLFSNNATINGGTGVTPTSEGVAARRGTDRSSTRHSGGCYADGEASLPVRMELAKGAVVESLVGYSLSYNTLDNNKNPTSGLYAELKQDFAGVGGDVNFIRTTGDARNYYEVFPDIVGVLHLQGGVSERLGRSTSCACSTTSRWVRTWCAASRRPASVRAI